MANVKAITVSISGRFAKNAILHIISYSYQQCTGGESLQPWSRHNDASTQGCISGHHIVSVYISEVQQIVIY